MPLLTTLIKAVEHLPPDAPFTDDDWHALDNCLPDLQPRSFSDIHNSIAELDQAVPRVRLIAILACLRGRRTSAGEPDAAQKIGDYVAATIAPCSRPERGAAATTAAAAAAAAADDDDLDDDDDHTIEDYGDVAQRVRETAVHGLEILRICSDEPAVRFSQDTILTLISYTDHLAAEHPRAAPAQWRSALPYTAAPPPPPHAWVAAAASEIAGQVLARQFPQRPAAVDALAATVLRDYLRPLFSKSRPGAVTASGRKAEFRDAQDAARGRLRREEETGEVKPWKYLDHRAIAVFRWAVHAASETLVVQQWPMFIPALLALLDDGTTRVRYVGLLVLPTFLGKFPDKILRDTGLASVIEDAVFSTLHFLPTITPEVESEQLLMPAYTSLLVLSRKLDPRVKSGPNGSRTPRGRLLDKMLRDGVFSSYAHAKGHVRLVCLWFYVTAELVQEMGIHAVKHLKDLIPMHGEVMTDPFAVDAPRLLQAAIYSLRAVLLTCWPRLDQPHHQDALVKTLVFCFLNVLDHPEAEGKLRRARSNLLTAAELVCTIARNRGGGSELGQKVAPLIATAPVLKTLFTSL